jgi:phosphomannomutase
MLQLLCDSGKPLSQVIAEYPRYAIVKDKLTVGTTDLGAVYSGLVAALPDAVPDRQDGLRLAWPDRWLHVRPSGTEPIVRFIAEAPTKDAAAALVNQAKALFVSSVRPSP